MSFATELFEEKEKPVRGLFVLDEMKRCSKCEDEFPKTIEYFKNDKNTKDGLYGQCRDCVSKRSKAYREKNNDHIVVYNHQYRKDNKDKRSEYQRKYREENRESYLGKSKLYRIANRDSRNSYNKNYILQNKEYWAEWHKRYRRENSESSNIKCQRYRAKKRNLPHTLTSDQWVNAKLYFDNKCSFCDKEVKLTKEHLAPVDNGGEFTRQNIIPSCKSCNSSKRNSEWKTWFRRQPTYSIEKEQKILDYLGYKNNKQQLALF